MEHSPERLPREFLSRLAGTREGGSLERFLRGKLPVWPEVDAAALSFAAAVLASSGRAPAAFVCADARARDKLADELETWLPGGAAFPEIPASVIEGALPDPEMLAERLDLLARIASECPPTWLALTPNQLDAPVPIPGRGASLHLEVGTDVEPDEIGRSLEKWGYERVPSVFARGQFARRGGILDVFSWQSRLPCRIEFFDTRIDSMREFDIDSQISTGPVDACDLLPPHSDDRRVPLRSLLAKWEIVGVDCDGIHGGQREITTRILQDGMPFPSLYSCPEAAFTAGDFVLDAVRRGHFFERLREWQGAQWSVLLFCDNEGERERFCELAAAQGADIGAFVHVDGNQSSSFVCPSARLAVLTDSDLFGRSVSRRIQRLARRRDALFSGRHAGDPSEFEEGDTVVHVEHGIGRYLGIRQIDGAHAGQLAIEFARGALLYVPIEQAWQVSRYIGLGVRNPPLSELGAQKWAKAKSRALGAVFSYAKEMLRLQAERETAPGFAYPRDSVWQSEFESAFPFRETPDQVKAIAETKADMEQARPMDRLVCGDVGFGKTEIAIRAAFKAVDAGRQVAFLAPTTVLAQQHFTTLRERMSDYPVRIDLLSRYRSRAEQARTLADIEAGTVDIAVGTHRLISGDVRWKNLGLLIVDEEQRFGVRHKELLKERFRLVDVLTLSATPIPRTLYLALMGARDMSAIDTPPPNRLPVETLVCGYDERILRDAIRREIDRGGQVYVLHNRVKTIAALAARIRELVPDARIAVGHGQMPEEELEEVMGTFVDGRSDVLVSTTIIESGLDIPNANTILIDRADLFGLADLYQLRGRVGRSGTKAFAYLFLPRALAGDAAARRRLSAIKQYSQLGAGFKIAMRDLEIRGAGNILGTAQSGHIVTVGFDLYCKMLRSAVEKLRGEEQAVRRVCPLRLDFMTFSEGEFLAGGGGGGGAFLPASYIRETRALVEFCRRANEAADEAALDALRDELRDRFGPLPTEAENYLLSLRIQLAAGKRGFSLIEVRGDRLMLTRRGDFLLLEGKFPRLTASTPDGRLRQVLQLLGSL